MKKLLLIISLFISSFAFSQSACEFTHSSNPGTLNVVSFMPDSILSNPYYYSWDFGDGNGSWNVDPHHTYNFIGNFLVCLSIYDSSTSSLFCQWCDTVNITNPVGGGCSFGWDTLGSNAVTFYAQASTSGSFIHWDFGDGQTDTGSVDTHTYASAGTYLVCMHETDGVGTVLCDYCYHVTVGAATSTNCSFSYSSDTISTFVQFFANVTAGSSVTWLFGDGTDGSGIDPHHTYNAPGPYVVCMTSVYNGITCIYCDTLTTGGSSIGSCSFVYSIDSIHPELVHFESSGIGALGNVFNWSFGDGTSGHGASESHQYSTSGTYDVCLTVSDSSTGVILCMTCEPVVVTGGPATCASNFISSSLGLTAYFIDLSNVMGATYYWSFGDGTYSDSHFPHHTYAASGTYTTCLTVSAGGCQSTSCLPTTVDSVITTPGCNANFVITQINPYEFVVVNLSSGLNINFHWDFGDGETSDSAYPSHYYNSIGTYVLCLTVSDFIGCSSTYCDTLSVDSLGNIAHRGLSGFTINIVSPATLTGVQDISSPTVFSLYPNPVSSELHVLTSDELKSTVTYIAYALDGREVATGHFTKKDNVLDVSGWNSGAYILETRNAEGFRSHQKIIKE